MVAGGTRAGELPRWLAEAKVAFMLTEIGLTDFKSYDKATLKLGRLTVMVGANASGKSNAIEGLRLLSWIAQGNRLGSLRYAGYQAKEPLRGAISAFARRGKGHFSLGAQIDAESRTRYNVSLAQSPDGELRIVDEKLVDSSSAIPLFEVVGVRGEGSNDLRVAYNNYARGGKKPQLTCTDKIAVLVQMQSAAHFEMNQKIAQSKIPRVCKIFQDTLGRSLFLDPQPATMRGYSFKSDHRLESDGSNLSGVLFNICGTPSGYHDLLSIIKSIPEQNIAAIEFIATQRDEVMVYLTETFGDKNTKFDATVLSDGTLRVLAVAAAVLSAEEGSLVVIEEIDNGVHPSRVRNLLETISAIAKRRRLIILISSHNPALLDALPDDAVPDVIFCYRDINSGASQLIQLQDIPNYPELIAQGTVGHLMTTGLMERFVKNHGGPEERRQKFDTWLENLRGRAAE
jgi:predicted ATPase